MTIGNYINFTIKVKLIRKMEKYRFVSHIAINSSFRERFRLLFVTIQFRHRYHSKIELFPVYRSGYENFIFIRLWRLSVWLRFSCFGCLQRYKIRGAWSRWRLLKFVRYLEKIQFLSKRDETELLVIQKQSFFILDFGYDYTRRMSIYPAHFTEC